jgi:tetratricopeptide (TPR) repeat protein
MQPHDYEAEGAYRDRAQANPSAAKVHGELAAWLMRTGRMAQAREALQTGLAQASRTAGLYHILGLIFAGAGEHGAAERHLKRAVAQDPSRFEYARDLAFIQGAAGSVSASVASLRQAASLGGGAEATGLDWLLRMGEHAAAESKERPSRKPPQVSRRAAVVEHLVTRDPEVAEALIPTRGDPTAEDRETLRAIRRALGRLASDNPSYPDLYFGISLVAEQLGEVQRAIEAAERALTLNPRYAEAALLAVRLYEKSGRPEQAAERCRQVTEMRPQWLDAHLRLGKLLREQGCVREAADAYRKAVELDGRCEEARKGLETLEASLQGGGGQ